MKGMFEIIAIVLTVTAVLSYLNHRMLKLHPSIGVMLMGLILSLALAALHAAGLPVKGMAHHIVEKIDFKDLVLEGLLGFLLFAAALQVDLKDLAPNRWRIGSFALASTLTLEGIKYFSNLHNGNLF